MLNTMMENERKSFTNISISSSEVADDDMMLS